MSFNWNETVETNKILGKEIFDDLYEKINILRQRHGLLNLETNYIKYDIIKVSFLENLRNSYNEIESMKPLTACDSHFISHLGSHCSTYRSTHYVTHQGAHYTSHLGSHCSTYQATHHSTYRATHYVTHQGAHRVTYYGTRYTTHLSGHRASYQATHHSVYRTAHYTTNQGTNYGHDASYDWGNQGCGGE